MAERAVGIIGFGKIARDQHAPAIAASADFRLAAVVTSGAGPDGVPTFRDWRAMLDAAALDAVVVATPPGPRPEIACACLARGLHVMLEKPPAATLGEVAQMQAAAGLATLFTAWHAQANAAVTRAADITHREGLVTLGIDWREDVEKWHPGQQWLWQPGGFGVFDPGINALSIATRLAAVPLAVTAAEFVMRGQQPVAADLVLAAQGFSGAAAMDWRHNGEEHWNVYAVTGAGTQLQLSEGGKTLRVNGGAPFAGGDCEYPALYARFAELIAAGASEVDAEPLRLVADAQLVARRS